MKRGAIARGRACAAGVTLLGAALVTWAALGVSSGAAQGDQLQEVREALKRAAQMYPQPLRGAQWSGIVLLGGSDRAVFQVHGKNERGNRIEAEISRAGRVIEVEEHGISVSEVPNAVVTTLKEKMPQFEPSKVEAIYQAQQARPVCYGFEGLDADGKRTEVYISADGRTFMN